MTMSTSDESIATEQSPGITAGMKETLELVEARIIHVLEIYPFLSASMIHMAIGTATPTTLWRPVLEQLLENGVVVLEELSFRTPQKRMQTYSIYHLPSNPYTYAPDPNQTSDAQTSA